MFCNTAFAECIEGDCINGYGTYTTPDGTKYVGEWKDSRPNGQGSLTSPNGTKYVGEWKNDKRHGQGTYTSPDGTIVNGIWKDGKLAEKAKKKKTSSLSSKEAKLIKRLMETENWTEKQAKCLVKKTKPLVKKEDWNKYVKLMQSKNQNLSDDDIGIVFEVSFGMMAHFSKCGVTN